MIHVNQAGLSQQVNAFDNTMSANLLSEKTDPLSKSEGTAIESINSCLASFDDYCTNINGLFSATSGYLHKALYNINLCEESIESN